jgi:hypothetical protein
MKCRLKGLLFHELRFLQALRAQEVLSQLVPTIGGIIKFVFPSDARPSS